MQIFRNNFLLRNINILLRIFEYLIEKERKINIIKFFQELFLYFL